MRAFRRQAGFTLIEVMIGLVILGFVSTAFLGALRTGTQATGTLDEQVKASALARSQLENIESLAYADSYSVTVTPPPDYTVAISTQVIDDPTCALEYLTPGPNSCNTLQKITVTVTRKGSGKFLLSMVTYKKK